MDDQVSRPEFDRHAHPEVRQAPPLAARARRRGRWWLLLPLVLLAGIGAFYLLHHAPAQRGRRGAQAAAQPVGAATIGTGDIRVILNELGTVTPLDTVTVMTQINGNLTQVAFKEGQMVTKGEFLAQIDDRPYLAALQRDQGQLAHDQGVLAQAQADLARYATLERQNSIAPQQAQDQRFLVQQDLGTVKADQGTVATDQLNVAYCHITAPIDGRVGLRLVDPGNYVQTSSTTGIAVITQMQPSSVIFSVPQQQVGEVETQTAKGGKLAVTAYDQANTKQIDAGTLETIDNEMDTSTGTVKMRAVFPNAQNQLFADQFVNAHLLVDTLAGVVRVPTAAVQVGQPGAFVWLIAANGKVTSQAVTLGPTDGQFEQVLTGLKPGDRVVSDGSDRLKDGMQVSVTPAPPAPGSAVQAAPTAGQRRRGTGQRKPAAPPAP